MQNYETTPKIPPGAPKTADLPQKTHPIKAAATAVNAVARSEGSRQDQRGFPALPRLVRSGQMLSYGVWIEGSADASVRQ